MTDVVNHSAIPLTPLPLRQRGVSLLTSICVHILLAVIAAVWTFSTEDRRELRNSLEADLVMESLPIEFEKQIEFQLPVQPDLLPSNSSAPSSTGQRQRVAQLSDPIISPPVSKQLQSSLDWEQALASSWAEADLITRFDPVGSAVSKFVKEGAGVGSGRGNGTSTGDTEFFGLNAPGRRFVYVIDGSKSMNRAHDSEAQTRFKRVKLELVKSIGSLPPESQFFILFFNDYAVAMPAPGLEAATLAAKQKHLLWMQQVITTGNTEPTAAITMALKLKPDVVYFLSDGDFNSRVRKELMDLPTTSAIVQSFAFQESLTDDMQRALDLLDASKPLAAQKAVRGKDYQKTLIFWRGQKFLREFSERHHGTLKLIP